MHKRNHAEYGLVRFFNKAPFYAAGSCFYDCVARFVHDDGIGVFICFADGAKQRKKCGRFLFYGAVVFQLFMVACFFCDEIPDGSIVCFGFIASFFTFDGFLFLQTIENGCFFIASLCGMVIVRIVFECRYYRFELKIFLFKCFFKKEQPLKRGCSFYIIKISVYLIATPGSMASSCSASRVWRHIYPPETACCA